MKRWFREPQRSLRRGQHVHLDKYVRGDSGGRDGVHELPERAERVHERCRRHTGLCGIRGPLRLAAAHALRSC